METDIQIQASYINTERDKRNRRSVIFHKIIYDINMDTNNTYLLKFNCKCDESTEIGIDMIGYSNPGTIHMKDYKIATSIKVYPNIYNYKIVLPIPKINGVQSMTKMPMFSHKYFTINDIYIARYGGQYQNKLLEENINGISSDLEKIGCRLRKVVCNDKEIDIFDIDHYEIFFK